MKKLTTLLFFFYLFTLCYSQGLDSIYVEKYYIASATDNSLEPNLPVGAVTYRIYVDMAPGYNFQAVYGDAFHPMHISTTGVFYNDYYGEILGEDLRDSRYNNASYHGYVLDSYLTTGHSVGSLQGVPKVFDPNGSGLTILTNNDPEMGVLLTAADGNVLHNAYSTVLTPGLEASMFEYENSSTNFNTNNGAWGIPGGSQGATSENAVLVAQITCTGEFSFQMNIQLGTPTGGILNYVYSNPRLAEIQHPYLTYPNPLFKGCTNAAACNYDPMASLDDGSCLVPVENCSECDGENLVNIDKDGDGILDCNEVAGCTNSDACNYNPLATDDNGSCIVPNECQVCQEGIAVDIDTDGDGVLDCNEVVGCMSESACNYNPLATDAGHCNEPIPNCYECVGDTIQIIDSNGDGVCDAGTIPGCTNSDACNFDPLATNDDGSCIVPVAECTECDGDTLMVIDTDGDGIGDCDEVPGCTNSKGCNYNPKATDDDGSCTIPDPLCETCFAGVIVPRDTDGDGIPNCEEIKGCSNPFACNYDPSATDDDGSCNIPVIDCSACDGDTLIIIDSDGNGICDREEPGLIDMLVEVYYISDTLDATDTDGGHLKPGSVTYRIFVDLRPGFKLQAIYGDPFNEMYIRTSTEFFNNGERGAGLGTDIRDTRLGSNTVALDSWLTIGAASTGHFGVLKTDDDNGSIVGGVNSDGGSEEIPGGILVNDSSIFGIPLTHSDGLIDADVSDLTLTPGLDISMFDRDNSSAEFQTNNGAWALLGGFDAALTNNKVLIAQITTDGELSFKLNMQVQSPDNEIIKYVADVADPAKDEVLMTEKLTKTFIPGCSVDTACNYDSFVNIDNGTCILPEFNCTKCNGEILELIDDDGDGICNRDEINSVTNQFNLTELKIYPNPTSGQITVEFYSNRYNGKVMYSLTDISGKVLFEEIQYAGTFETKHQLDLSALHNGIYILSIITVDGLVEHKEIIIN